MAKINTLRDLLIEELRDLYHAEKQLVRAVPKLVKAVEADAMKTHLRDGLEKTKGRIERLESVFESLETRTRGKPCHAMEGLLQEAEEVLEADYAPKLRDAALVAALQKAVHYSIASYGTVAAFAKAVGEEEAAGALGELLQQMRNADEEANEIASSTVNPRALEGDDESAPEMKAAAGDKPRRASKS